MTYFLHYGFGYGRKISRQRSQILKFMEMSQKKNSPCAQLQRGNCPLFGSIGLRS